MSGLFALIQMGIYVFIIYAVIRNVKKKSGNTTKTSSAGGSVGSDYSTPQRVYPSGNTTTRPTIASGSRPIGGTTASMPKPATVSSSLQTEVKTESSVWGTDDVDGGSVTDYLAEKARQDQISHAEEKREEDRRLNAKSGGLQAAERLYEGELVPSGKHCVVCSYCAAENLIPNGSRMRYSCYFCREPLA